MAGEIANLLAIIRSKYEFYQKNHFYIRGTLTCQKPNFKGSTPVFQRPSIRAPAVIGQWSQCFSFGLHNFLDNSPKMNYFGPIIRLQIGLQLLHFRGTLIYHSDIYISLSLVWQKIQEPLTF